MFEAVLKFRMDESANTWLQGWVGFITITPSPAETFDQSDFTVQWNVDHYECPRFGSVRRCRLFGPLISCTF